MDDEKNRIVFNVKEYSSSMIKELTESSVKRISKNAENSAELCIQANKIFEKESHSSQEHLQMWELYSKSVALASPLSQELSAVLYDRSSLLFHLAKYTECMKDLTYAETCECSDMLRMKIIYRKAECSTKVWIPSDSDIVGSAMIEIQSLSLDDKLKNETIAKLDKLRSEPAPTSSYARQAESKSLDIDLQEEIPYFETENGKAESLSVRLVIRALKESNGSISNLKEKFIEIDGNPDRRNNGFSKDGIFHSESCDSYLSLLSNADKKTVSEKEAVSKRSAKLVYYIAFFTDVFGKKFSAENILEVSEREDVLFIGSLISRMYFMIISNQFTLAEQTDVTSRYQPSFYQSEKTLGAVVAPFCSYINHACLMNVATCMTEDGRLIIFAVLPIVKDSQIFKKYMKRIGCDVCPRDLRTFTMNEVYNIPHCKCIACIENLPTAYEAPGIFSITEDEEVLK
ncbi:hypothetical protein QAD02_008731 [Eretmocerus hayati]|uniref:Uncharacterized protein n=1 Tax=Eretmocerus hayati TaxID=131215 RepID=A0ACC2N9R2_9HYME|nr:hypothetical protein QAD02_008731 [Eretmocerus hayati]